MKLTKKTYLSTDADKLIDRNFNEIGKKTSSVNISSFFQTYKDIFFRIPKRGTNSHLSLYEESGKFIGNPESSDQLKLKNKDRTIKDLQSQISNLTHKNEMLSSINIAQELEIKKIKQI
jgi:hypothetical protein|tara:strand:+ start:234 stop:590 length:357 start_codon:yes stop_codon:yes gene_type:complete